MIFALFIDTVRVLKSSILFKNKRENVIYLSNSVMYLFSIENYIHDL